MRHGPTCQREKRKRLGTVWIEWVEPNPKGTGPTHSQLDRKGTARIEGNLGGLIRKERMRSIEPSGGPNGPTDLDR